MSLLSDVRSSFANSIQENRGISLPVESDWGVALPEVYKQKTRDNITRMRVYHQDEQRALVSPMFYHIMSLANKTNEIPHRNTFEYVQWLDKLWKEEPVLAGAVYSMVAKMQSMTWRIEGGRNNATYAADMLSRAQYMYGNEWGGFIGASAIDFYGQDNGVWWDVTRRGGNQWDKIADLAHIDTRCCIATGSAITPMLYRSSIISEEHWYKPGEYIHFGSMMLPDQRELGMGYCAVSRAARAAKLLMAVHNYDAEKLSNLPPEGIGAITGLTDREFRNAIAIWMAERKSNNSLTFPQVLWLVGNNPGATVKVDIASFSSIPEQFDRNVVIQQYVNTLALCFGVDTREFWAISTAALGTASEAEVQHLKAKGKGGGEFLTMVERALNAELPGDAVFRFDTQDIEEDMVAATVAKAWIDAYIPLLFPKDPTQEAVLDAATFKRLLADRGVIPEWVVGDDRVSIASHEVHKEYLEDLVRFIWDAGRVRESMIASLRIDTRPRIDNPVVEKQEDVTIETTADKPNIRGKPIADDEVDRGAKITATSIRNELKYWKTIPELARYVE
jgi:hypothetical protein